VYITGERSQSHLKLENSSIVVNSGII